MGIHEVDEAIRLINQNAEHANFGGGASQHAIAKAEKAVGIKFPPSYARFLSELGGGHFAEQTFFGVQTDGEDRSLDLVWHTLDQRQNGNLPDTHVVIGPYGEEAFFGFDCAARRSNEECPVAEFPRDYGDIQEPNYFELDFGSFLLARIRDVLGHPSEFRHP